MSNVALAVALICSNSLAIQSPETSCVALTHPFPTMEACEAANKEVMQNIHTTNKKLAPDKQFYFALLECISVDRPDLNQGS